MNHNNPLHTSLIDLIADFRSTHNKPGQLVTAVMVSGGLDSMVLAKVVNDLKKELNLVPILVYVNFVDFPEHEKTTNFILDYSEQCKVPVLVYDPEGYNDTKTSAREAMKSAGMSVDADIVLTGHHADDQIETFLFRAFRGSGVEGLASMRPLSEFIDPRTNKVRVFGKPFLKLLKEELKDWTFWSVPYINDSSNLDNGPSRNYIRNEVIPKVTDRFEKKNILSTIDAINDYLDADKEKQQYEEVNYLKGSWHINTILSLPVLNRVFLIRHYIRKIHGHNLNKKAIGGLKSVFSSDLTDLRHYIAQNLLLTRNGDYVSVVKLP